MGGGTIGLTHDTWPGGATYVRRTTITNQAGQGASNVELIFTPAGEGEEFEILYGSILNGDTVGRQCRAEIDDGTSDESIARVFLETVSGGAVSAFPAADAPGDGTMLAAGARLLISGPMRLRLMVVSVADGQDATFAIVLRLRGSNAPTMTTVGAGTETVSDDINRVV